MLATSRRSTDRAAWIALLVAFSPAWIELGQHLRARSEDRYVVVPLAALALLAWRERRASPNPFRPRVAVAAGALAALLLLIGIAGSASLLSRLSLPVAMFALAALLGRPRPAVLVLALALLPVPGSLLYLTSPGLESSIATLAASMLSAIGFEVAAVGPLLRAPHGDPLQLSGQDGGVPLAITLGALGWASALWNGARPRAAAMSALRFSSLAVVAQPLALCAAAALVACGAAGSARTLLSTGVFALAATGTVVYTARAWVARQASTART